MTATEVTITIPVTDPDATTTNYRGDEFKPVRVHWQAYIYAGHGFLHIVAYSDRDIPETTNRSYNPDGEPLPAWMPLPPAAWLELADQVLTNAPKGGDRALVVA